MHLEIRDLTIAIQSQARDFDVVDHVNISIPERKVIALVGESGCGKSLTALSILRLLPKPAVHVSTGQILWCARSGAATGSPSNLLTLNDRQMLSIRGRDIAMIFQEPMTALNPVFTIGEQIAEVLILHRCMTKNAAWHESADLLAKVGIADAPKRLRQYPHEFSGGMRQRVLIAMALAGQPRLLIADEPTTALDVTVQAQILDLLRSLQADTGMSILLITHDLGVVAQLADYVYVMYAGRIVEHAPSRSLFAAPIHPYTKGLFACTPRLDDAASTIEPIPGTVPEPANFPTGCRFHPRCELSCLQASATTRHSICMPDQMRILRRCVDVFSEELSGVPPLREARPGHFVACWEA